MNAMRIGYEHYKKTFRETLLPKVMEVVSGEKAKVESFIHFPLWSMRDVLVEEGFEEGEMNTNGWQWDYWQEFIYNGKYYTLKGSGFYGAFEFYTSE